MMVFPKNSDSIDIVERVFASTSRNPQSSVVEFSSQID